MSGHGGHHEEPVTLGDHLNQATSHFFNIFKEAIGVVDSIASGIGKTIMTIISGKRPASKDAHGGHDAGHGDGHGAGHGDADGGHDAKHDAGHGDAHGGHDAKHDAGHGDAHGGHDAGHGLAQGPRRPLSGMHTTSRPTLQPPGGPDHRPHRP